jgi:hypothetical protein
MAIDPRGILYRSERKINYLRGHDAVDLGIQGRFKV